MSGGKAQAGEIARLTIEGLGGLGEGLGRHQGVPVHVPLTAPGDLAEVLIGPKRGDGVAGRLMTLVQAGDSRRAPPCPYFGECGGCAVQHLAPEIYFRWKEGLIGEALARHGLVAEIRPIQAPEPNDSRASRRRAVFAGENRDGAVAIGFNARATHKIVPIERCLLLTPALNRLIGFLPELMRIFLADDERGQAAITDLAGSIDILIMTPRPPGRVARERVAAFIQERHITRVSWREAKLESATPETIVERGPCRISFAGAMVDFPPGGFIQPSAWGEAMLQRLVIEGMGKAGRVVELFGGIGTLAFALAGAWGRDGRWKLAAFERNPALADAFRQGANRAGFSGKLSVETRDLDRRPLLPEEFASYDGIILDPPRAGAKAQSQFIARVDEPTRAVMVSCNPATFARDARILVDGGWTLERVMPVDQFLYSAHLELVAVFVRPKASRKKLRGRREIN